MQIPDSPAFVALEALQRRIDDHIGRKRSSIREAVMLPDHPKRKLRLYISNSHAHQRHSHHPLSDDRTLHPSGSKSGSGSEPASWTLLISGRVLDPEAAVPVKAPSAVTSQPTAVAITGVVSGTSAPLLPGGLQAAAGSGAGPSGGSASLASPATQTPAAPVAPKFPTTFYFRRIEIQLDPSLYPGESGHIVWEKV